MRNRRVPFTGQRSSKGLSDLNDKYRGRKVIMRRIPVRVSGSMNNYAVETVWWCASTVDTRAKTRVGQSHKKTEYARRIGNRSVQAGKQKRNTAKTNTRNAA